MRSTTPFMLERAFTASLVVGLVACSTDAARSAVPDKPLRPHYRFSPPEGVTEISCQDPLCNGRDCAEACAEGNRCACYSNVLDPKPADRKLSERDLDRLMAACKEGILDGCDTAALLRDLCNRGDDIGEMCDAFWQARDLTRAPPHWEKVANMSELGGCISRYTGLPLEVLGSPSNVDENQTVICVDGNRVLTTSHRPDWTSEPIVEIVRSKGNQLWAIRSKAGAETVEKMPDGTWLVGSPFEENGPVYREKFESAEVGMLERARAEEKETREICERARACRPPSPSPTSKSGDMAVVDVDAEAPDAPGPPALTGRKSCEERLRKCASP